MQKNPRFNFSLTHDAEKLAKQKKEEEKIMASEDRYFSQGILFSP